MRDQIIAKRIRIKKGNIQDASFIEADKGEYGKPGEMMQRPADLRVDHRRQRIMRNSSDTGHIPF